MGQCLAPTRKSFTHSLLDQFALLHNTPRMHTSSFTKVAPRAALLLSLPVLIVCCSDPFYFPNVTSSSSSSSSGSAGSAGNGGAGGAGGESGNGGNGGSGGGPVSSISFVGCPCPPRYVNDIVACADGLAADPQFTSYTQAIIACSKAESVADAYAQSCAEDKPTPLYCSVADSQFWLDLQDQCINDSITAFAERTCVFGARYRDIFQSKRLLVLSSRVLDANSSLTNIEAAQLVSAIEPSSHTATTPSEVFAAVDAGQVNQVELADRWNGRRYTVFEYGAGDNSYGRFFITGTNTGVADIQDGDLYACNADLGPGGEDCNGFFMPDTCPSTLVCAGPAMNGNDGLCSLITPVSTDGFPCATPFDCGPDGYCTNVGICISPWKTGVFNDIAFAPLVDGSDLKRTIVVKGLATVPINALMDLVIRHPDTSELTVTLINPLGTETTVFQGNPAGQDLILTGVQAPVLGDESINGVWTLRIQDAQGGQTGWLSHWRIFFTSRWD